MNLEQETRKLLEDHMAYRVNTYEKVAESAGVGVPWLKSFRLSQDKGYDHRLLQKLYDYLIEKGE